MILSSGQRTSRSYPLSSWRSCLIWRFLVLPSSAHRHVSLCPILCECQTHRLCASRCRFTPQTMSKSFVALWIPNRSNGVLSATYSSLSTVDSDLFCCFLTHTFKQCPSVSLQLTPIVEWLCHLVNRRLNMLPAHHSVASGTGPLLATFPRDYFHSSWHVSGQTPMDLPSHNILALPEIWSVLWQITDACHDCSDHMWVLDCRSRRYVRHLSSARCSCRHDHPHDHHPLASISSCIVLLLVHVAWRRCVIRLIQLKILQYLRDMSLTRLDRDVVATPLDDTIEDSSNLLEIRIFTHHQFLDLAFSWYNFDEEIHRRSSSQQSWCHLHARLSRYVLPWCNLVIRMDTRFLTSTWGRWLSMQPLPHNFLRRHAYGKSRIATARTCVLQLPYNLLTAIQRISFVVERDNTFLARRQVTQLFLHVTRDNLWQHYFQRVQRRRRRVSLWTYVCLFFLRVPPRAHIGLPWLSPVNVHPSCPNGRVPCFTRTRLSGHACIHLVTKNVLHLLMSGLGTQLRVKSSTFEVIPTSSLSQTESFLLVANHGFLNFILHVTCSFSVVLMKDPSCTLCLLTSFFFFYLPPRPPMLVQLDVSMSLINSSSRLRCLHRREHVDAYRYMFFASAFLTCRAEVRARMLTNPDPRSSHTTKTNTHKVCHYSFLSCQGHDPRHIFHSRVTAHVSSCTKSRVRVSYAPYSSPMNFMWSFSLLLYPLFWSLCSPMMISDLLSQMMCDRVLLWIQRNFTSETPSRTCRRH